MDVGDFVQGMSHADALSKGTLFSQFNGPDNIMSSIAQHFSSLPSRPDYDGEVTFSEALDWFHYGGGKPLFIDIGKMNFKSSTLSVEGHFQGKSFSQANFFWADTHPFSSDIPWVGGDHTMAFVYGTLRINLLDRHTGLIGLRNSEQFGGGFDRFDFNISAFEWVGENVRSGGNPIPFNFMGYGNGNIHLTIPTVH